MAALRPVLSAIPDGAHISDEQEVKPIWDSCDGIKSTYGWDDVTVAADFTVSDSAERTVATIDQAVRRLGWTPSIGSGHGAWYWHHTLAGGADAEIQLLGGPGTQPGDWSLQATVPAATHPVKGC